VNKSSGYGDNIMIEHLKNLRSDVASTRAEMHTEFKDVKARLNHLDASLAGVVCGAMVPCRLKTSPGSR
jgi:hypothetical protein